MKLPPSSEIVLAMLGAGKALTNKEIITEDPACRHGPSGTRFRN